MSHISFVRTKLKPEYVSRALKRVFENRELNIPIEVSETPTLKIENTYPGSESIHYGNVVVKRQYLSSSNRTSYADLGFCLQDDGTLFEVMDAWDLERGVLGSGSLFMQELLINQNLLIVEDQVKQLGLQMSQPVYLEGGRVRITASV